MSKHKRPSRPTRAERSAKALIGVDVSQCDPKRVLQEIASDPTAPAGARVSAARTLALMADVKARAVEKIAASGPERAAADVNERAVEAMARRPN